jgi:LacI family transcriptional regulator
MVYKMVKLKDVAVRAGVSEGTASLVLNNKAGVNARTREKVLQAANSLGYHPNRIARGLATKKTSTIGLLITDIENPFFGSLTRYIDEHVKKEGYSLILSVSNNLLGMEEKIIFDFLGKRVDGLVLVPTLMNRTDFSCFRALENHKIPFVFSTAYYRGLESDCVMTDLREGSYRLTKYLLDLGHREIVLLTSPVGSSVPSQLRAEGYKRALRDSGLLFEESNIIECEKADYYNGYETAKGVLRKRKPDAITAINDIMALGAKEAALETGYSIPAEISVAGYDDVVFSRISELPLTTVKQDIARISEETVSKLMGRIRGESGPTGVKLISPELIVRKSTTICKKTVKAT